MTDQRDWTTADEWFAEFLKRCTNARRKFAIKREAFVVSEHQAKQRAYDEETEMKRRFLAARQSKAIPEDRQLEIAISAMRKEAS